MFKVKNNDTKCHWRRSVVSTVDFEQVNAMGNVAAQLPNGTGKLNNKTIEQRVFIFEFEQVFVH